MTKQHKNKQKFVHKAFQEVNFHSLFSSSFSLSLSLSQDTSDSIINFSLKLTLHLCRPHLWILEIRIQKPLAWRNLSRWKGSSILDLPKPSSPGNKKGSVILKDASKVPHWWGCGERWDLIPSRNLDVCTPVHNDIINPSCKLPAGIVSKPAGNLHLDAWFASSKTQVKKPKGPTVAWGTYQLERSLEDQENLTTSNEKITHLSSLGIKELYQSIYLLGGGERHMCVS